MDISDRIAQFATALGKVLVPHQLQPDHDGGEDLDYNNTHGQEAGVWCRVPGGLA